MNAGRNSLLSCDYSGAMSISGVCGERKSVSEIGNWFYIARYLQPLASSHRTREFRCAGIGFTVLPQTLIGPTAGVVNDRLRRKHVMIPADIGRMVIVFCMLFVRSREMVWLVYPLLVAETVLAAFFEPARNSVIPNIVAREDVVIANTLSSATWSVNLMLGSTAGGLVAALFGREAVFLFNALWFLISAALILRMHFSEPHAEGTLAAAFANWSTSLPCWRVFATCASKRGCALLSLSKRGISSSAQVGSCSR